MNCNKKCILLVRVSTDHQDIKQQTNKVYEEACRDGYDKSNIIIIEDTESAVKLSEEQRSGLNKMKSYIEDDPSINCIYCYEISRISRQAKIVFSIRDYLLERRIQLVILYPYFRMLKDDLTLSETSNIFFGIFASMAENEGYIRKARLRRGREKKRAIGKYLGGPMMFGYTSDRNHNYILDPVNSEIVKRIFHKYVYEGFAMRKLAKEIQDEGYFPNTKYLTVVQTINNILHRDVYCGAKTNIPAIITKEVYDAAQRKMKENILCSKTTPTFCLCKGILKDKQYGLLLSANSCNKTYYSKRCDGVGVSFKGIDSVIWDYVVEKHSYYNRANNSNIAEKINSEIERIEKKKLVVKKKIVDINNKIDYTEERLIFGKITEAAAEKIESKLKDEINELDSKLKRYNDEIKYKSMQLKSTKRKIKNTINYDKCSEEDKYNIVHETIYHVLLSRISRTKMLAEVYNKFDTEVTILTIDTYHGKLISKEIK